MAKECGYCGRSIRENARYCPYCHRNQDEKVLSRNKRRRELKSEKTSSEKNSIMAGFVCIVFVIIILFVVYGK